MHKLAAEGPISHKARSFFSRSALKTCFEFWRTFSASWLSPPAAKGPKETPNETRRHPKGDEQCQCLAVERKGEGESLASFRRLAGPEGTAEKEVRASGERP